MVKFLKIKLNFFYLEVKIIDQEQNAFNHFHLPLYLRKYIST